MPRSCARPFVRLALALALLGCEPRANDVTPIDARVDDARADGASDGPPPCVLGGTMTGAPATVACGGNASGRVVLAGDDVLWTVQQPGGVLMKAPLVGGVPKELVRAKVGAVGLVVVDAYAYFTLPGANQVLRVPLAGGQAEVVTGALDFPLFVASDGASLFVTSGQKYAGVVSKVSLDPRTANAHPPLTLMDGLPGPRGLAVADGFVYWTDVFDGALLRTADRPDDAAHDGGTRVAARLAAGLSGPSDLALAGRYAYVADQRGSLARIPLVGGDPELFTDARGTPYGVATDGASLYWTTRGNPGGVFKIPLAGGAPLALVTGEADAHFLSVGVTAVVWGTWGNGGAIRRVAK
ncbi:MAG: repeat domain protein [Myxococcales bacterium]|nr:repeat domain protein [Myxococcales bacterium]